MPTDLAVAPLSPVSIQTLHLARLNSLMHLATFSCRRSSIPVPPSKVKPLSKVVGSSFWSIWLTSSSFNAFIAKSKVLSPVYAIYSILVSNALSGALLVLRAFTMAESAPLTKLNNFLSLVRRTTTLMHFLSLENSKVFSTSYSSSKPLTSMRTVC